MATIEMTEKRLSDVVRYEEPTALYSRDQVVAGADLEVGNLLKISADGVATLASATDTPTAVAIYKAQNGSRATVIARHAVINEQGVIYPSGATDAQKKTINAGLKLNGILVRS